MNKALTTISTAICNMRISTDGSKLVYSGTTTGYGTGICLYNLTTPFDISSGVFAGFVPCTVYSGSYVSFDITPDGTRMIMSNAQITGGTPSAVASYIYEYTLGQPWVVTTAQYSGVSVLPTSISGSLNFTSVRFNANGTQIIFGANNGSNTAKIYWIVLGTPYRLATASTTASQYFTIASLVNIYGAFQTPDGLNLITTTDTPVCTSNTLSTAYNMTFATTTNGVTTATNKFTWPTGTVASASTVLGMDMSPDGTKFYAVPNATGATGTIYQIGVIGIPQTSYTCTYPTQGSAPTNVAIPDRSVAQTITTTLSGGVMTFSAPTVATNARGIALKIASPKINTSITNATLSMWHS
jgi:hypothetical protein